MKNGNRDWGAFVLLLIDLQRDFWSEQVAERHAHFQTNIVRLLDLCRTEGIKVVHLRSVFKPDRSDWMPVYKLRGTIPCVQGTVGAETLPFAVENPGEKVIVKQTFDSFQNPELVPYLRGTGKRFVLAAGLLTSVCVLLTAASAVQKGFLTAVVADCCADRSQVHEQTLEAYPFMFEQVRLGQILDRYPEWKAALAELERIES